MNAAALVSGLIAFTLFGIMGIWDGLVRRHVRVDLDAFQIHLHLRGAGASAVGILSVLLVGSSANLGLSALPPAVAGCHTAGCLVSHLVIPVVTTWWAVVLLLIGVGIFAMWLPGAGDRQGPYQRRLLAPGVWDREKDLLSLVETRLAAAHLPSVPEDTVIEVGSWVKQQIGLLSLGARERVIRDGHFDASAIVHQLRARHADQQFHVAAEALEVMLRAAVDHYLDLYARVAMAYPWGRRNVQWRGDRDRLV